MLKVLILTVENEHHNSQRFKRQWISIFHTAFFNRSRQTSKSSSYVNQALIERLAQEVVLLTQKHQNHIEFSRQEYAI